MPLFLEDVALFERAAASGSLSEAARQLALTPQIASRRLARLEDHLSVRLLHRTTRSSGLTTEGEAFLPAAMRVLEEAQNAEESVGLGSRSVRGLLRVTAPATFGRKVLAPLLPPLLSEHPELRIDLQLTDSQVDMVEEGLDLAVRIAAELPKTRALARKLADNPLVLVASPAYINQRGTPRLLSELTEHGCLTRTGSDVWFFRDPRGARRQIRVGGPFSSNAFEALREAVLGGAGIGLHSHWDVADEVVNGSLKPIKLEDVQPDMLSIWLLRPAGTVAPGRKLEVMSETLREAIDPWSDRSD